MYLSSVSKQVFIGNIFSNWSLIFLVDVLFYLFENYSTKIVLLNPKRGIKDYKNVYQISKMIL